MLMTDVIVRPARLADADAIARLNNTFADAGLMLRRAPAAIALAIDDYVVAADGRGVLVGCGALKEYSPSLGEVAAIAVAPDAHGRGVGKAVVGAVEALALKRGIDHVFALTLQPGFFDALGYEQAERARFPEKIRRDCVGCARRFACTEICFAKRLAVTSMGAMAA